MNSSVFTAAGHNPLFPKAAINIEPSVVWVMVDDGSARLLDMDGSFYALPPEGALMLDRALHYSFEQAIDKITAHYGIERSQITVDLNRLIEELEARQLIYRPDRPNTISREKKDLKRVKQLIRIIYRVSPTLPGLVWCLMVTARISCLIYGWHASVTAWQDVRVRIVKAMNYAGASEAVRQVHCVLRSVSSCHIFGTSCKERALTAWSLLRALQFNAELVMGITLFPFSCHCWCQCNSVIVADDPLRIRHFKPVFFYS